MLHKRLRVFRHIPPVPSGKQKLDRSVKRSMEIRKMCPKRAFRTAIDSAPQSLVTVRPILSIKPADPGQAPEPHFGGIPFSFLRLPGLAGRYS